MLKLNKEKEMAKIIYWNYMLWIFIYSVFLVTIAMSIGRLFEYIMPTYDTEQKKIFTLAEIYLQVGTLTVVIYIFREYLNALIRGSFKVYGKPEQYALLVLPPILFGQQPNLMRKIKSVWKTKTVSQIKSSSD